jgi:hypothetical protein
LLSPAARTDLALAAAGTSVVRYPIDRRGQELDTIAAVLRMERRDELAELLTDQLVERLRHLISEGMGANPCAL